ncbi:MAG: TetR/AcrR family transcriptional regulator [Deltaproteobacteria bacterium]|nr:TetR/AcrR family transcriptional regulator [Deltaproteobacteria bacterium]MBW2723744.1 TetR/AcrR family transcriptional regulator [Deltaproteobacteria bacterium]
MGSGDSLEETWGAQFAAEHPEAPHPALVDQTGRVLGKRAQGTRQRLLDSTEQLLEAQSLRDLRVIDIARNVGASPATFYQYFKDVEEAVLALAEQASQEMPAVAELLEGSWQGKPGLDRARAIVLAFIDLWDRHHAALRVRNLASDEGDERFKAVRGRAMSPVLLGLARQFEESQRAGRVSMHEDPRAAAAAMGAILERMGAYHRELVKSGVSREKLIETSARILHRGVTGATGEEVA